MADLWLDLRFGLRMLRRNRGFAAISILVLAIGIGANTTIFSVVNGVLLQPLPYPDADRLLVVWNDFGDHGQSYPAVSPGDFRDYTERSRLIEEFGALAPGSLELGLSTTLTGRGEPEQLTMSAVTANFFSMLGTHAEVGRTFSPDEAVPNGPRVVVLSHGLWQRRFGGDPDVVGRSLRLGGAAYTVVGVLPPDFELLLPPEAFAARNPDIWIPVQVDPDAMERNLTFYFVLARLAEGATLEQAQAEMDGVAERLRAEHPIHRTAGLRIRLVPYHSDVVQAVRPTLLLLLGAVGFVLLIACANVAHLYMVRATARSREIAVRAALGAGRGRILRQLLAESVLLAASGGLAGLLLAIWGLDFLVGAGPSDLPRLAGVRVDGRVLAFSAAASLLTAVLFGLVPALQAGRTQLSQALKESAARANISGASRLRDGLIALEVALSVVLLIGTGLLLRTFVSMLEVDPGFRAERVLSGTITVPPTRYADFEAIRRFFEQLEERVAELPRVESVGAISQLPLSGTGMQAPYAYDDETAQQWESISADWRIATPGFLETVGARLKAGRWFDRSDTADGEPVVVVDELMARKAWPGEDPLDKRLQVIFFAAPNSPQMRRVWCRVVGVVEHIRNQDLTLDVREQMYLAHAQMPFNQMSVVVRSSQPQEAIVRAVSHEVRALDQDLPLYDVRPLASYVSQASAHARFSLVLLGLFAGVALVLASVGIYGVVSYAVGRRTAEIGFRIALGARRRDIFRLVVGRGMSAVTLGLALGLFGALALRRSLEGLLYGVASFDPATFIGVALLLSAVALAASYLPARRAARVDPMVALRCE